MDRNAKGISLIELLIMVVMISVVATAFWNSRAHRGGDDTDYASSSSDDGGIAAALDEIASNVKFAAHSPQGVGEPLITSQGARGDHIQVFQNNSCVEYFVDEQGCLVRRANSRETVLGDSIASLRLTRMGKETVVITISGKSDGICGNDSTAQESRTFSAVVGVGGHLDRTDASMPGAGRASLISGAVGADK